MHIARHVVEGSGDLGMKRVAQIEDERPAHSVIVGEKHTAGGHGVLGVMHLHGLLIGHHGGHQMTVGGGKGVGVDHGEEIFAFERDIAGPGEQE